MFKGYDKKKYNSIRDELKEKGFSVKEFVSDATSEKKYNLIKTITINGEKFSGGDCYVPVGSEITVFYYETIIPVPGSAYGYISKTLDSVEKELRDSGFTNIIAIAESTTSQYSWGNRIVSISINGDSDFAKGDYYEAETEIIITYKK